MVGLTHFFHDFVVIMLLFCSSLQTGLYDVCLQHISALNPSVMCVSSISALSIRLLYSECT